MQQARRDFRSHALSKRQLADRRIHEWAESKAVDESVSCLTVRVAFQSIDPRDQFERIRRRKVIPELRALPEHGADVLSELSPFDSMASGQGLSLHRSTGAGYLSGS